MATSRISNVLYYLSPSDLKESLPGRGQPLGSFLSTSFGHQYVFFFNRRDFVSCCIMSSTEASVDLCNCNSVHGVFVLTSHHMTVSSQSGFYLAQNYFINPASN